jgi:RNA polymerase sigma factor (sigma-70 family)
MRLLRMFIKAPRWYNRFVSIISGIGLFGDWRLTTKCRKSAARFNKSCVAVFLEVGVTLYALALQPQETAVSSERAHLEHVGLTALSDDALMEHVVANDRAAFEVLCVRHGARLVASARRMLGDREQALEVAQEVWLGLWNARASYVARGTFQGYLATLLYNRCRNAHRTRSRSKEELGDSGLEQRESGVASAEEVLTDVETEHALQSALAHLEQESREAVVLR